MTFIPRVKETAYLHNATGSVAIRNNLVDKLSDNFDMWVLQKFSEGNGKLSRKEMQDYYKQTYPGINIKVTNKCFWGGIGAVIPKISIINKSIKGYTFFVSKKNFNPLALSHEDYHLNDFLVNPKKMARTSEVEKMYIPFKVDGVWSFFRKTLDNKICNTKKIISEEEKLNTLKSQIKNFFKWRLFSSNQKITALQFWRYMLSSENGAYNSSTKYFVGNFEPAEPYLGQNKEEVFRKWKCFDFEKRLYPQKIQLLNEMLAEEIKNHRAKHAADLRARKSLTENNHI